MQLKHIVAVYSNAICNRPSGASRNTRLIFPGHTLIKTEQFPGRVE